MRNRHRGSVMFGHPSGLRWTGVSLGVIVLDQTSKVLAAALLPFQQPVGPLPFFNLTLTHNTGAAFSLLSQESGWQVWALGTLAVAVSLAIVVWLARLPRRRIWRGIALALILGGALGNLIDRVVHGYVIDFLDFYVGRWHWPAFNLADSAVCVGAVMLAIEIFFGERD